MSAAATKKNSRATAWGPELPKLRHDASTERDIMLLRSVIRNEALATYDRAMTPGGISDLVSEDIASIGEIKNSTMRMQAMQSVRQSRAVRPDYKVEFSRLAPALAREVDATRATRNVHPPELRLLVRPTPWNPLSPSVRAKVAAFLYSQPESVIDQYPDLAPAYGTVDAARKFAQRNFPGYVEKFVSLAIDAVVGNIESGEPISDPGLKIFPKYGDRRGMEPPEPLGPNLVR